MGAEQLIADAILSHQLDLLRLEAGTAARVIALLDEMQRDLRYRLASEDLTAFSRARLQAMLRQATAAIDAYYAKMQGLLELTMNGAAEIQATQVSKLINMVLVGAEAKLPTEIFLARLVSTVLIQGAPSAEWWGRQTLDTSRRFADVVRAGVAQGMTNEQIVARVAGSTRLNIPGIMQVARRNARSLVHTSIQTVANAARVETFEKNSDIAECLVWLATLDPHTCIVCASRDLHEYSFGDRNALDGGPPWGAGPGAIHWGCRCVATIKPRSSTGIPLPIGERASSSGSVKGNTSFRDYLDRMGTQFQNDVLGPGRAQLWRDGKLTLEQLLDLRGNPLTLKQLRAKYN